MSKFIKVLAASGSVRDCTVGKLYHVEQEMDAGETYVFNGERRTAPVPGFVITDDVGDSVALRAAGDPDAHAWKLVTE
ncbi:hypothetical protein [Pantoea phage LIMEzero]|uniref:Uncharacterized protein n=1 Tax=Pantoea phage LIMEzero TaxID=943335 RepID=F4N9Q7_9CAUD|nr:hypothetical protein LIMEzero_ORF04 [Pantoea phage LIMEzero]CBY88535.1 hypothetical protein [Pantoea phage LIMEzero]